MRGRNATIGILVQFHSTNAVCVHVCASKSSASACECVCVCVLCLDDKRRAGRQAGQHGRGAVNAIKTGLAAAGGLRPGVRVQSQDSRGESLVFSPASPPELGTS